MDFDEDMMKELVDPIPGAKQGTRIRYVQFADSMYNAPAHPYDRARTYMSRFRGWTPELYLEDKLLKFEN